MAVKIRLTRMGKIRNPQYRVVVKDSRDKRDGKFIENLGIYQPKANPSIIQVDSERVQYWLSVGAQPSEPVHRILCRTGDWQKFKGLPAPAEIKVAEPKTERDTLYEAALKEAGIDPAATVVVEDTKTKKSENKADESASTEEVKEEKAESAKTEEKGE
ncbi:30S ribosomal protein S16 [Haloglycomyces albus]|uniref:30S ribosomal protein S16 n=1 Tax=Haloglycomyces albus TaxID=526067 RepID=UPI00046D756C|nr:30S ribosomal protein S16 [Haloglycomyces albus]